MKVFSLTSLHSKISIGLDWAVVAGPALSAFHPSPSRSNPLSWGPPKVLDPSQASPGLPLSSLRAYILVAFQVLFLSFGLTAGGAISVFYPKSCIPPSNKAAALRQWHCDHPSLLGIYPQQQSPVILVLQLSNAMGRRKTC